MNSVVNFVLQPTHVIDISTDSFGQLTFRRIGRTGGNTSVDAHTKYVLIRWRIFTTKWHVIQVYLTSWRERKTRIPLRKTTITSLNLSLTKWCLENAESNGRPERKKDLSYKTG
jgi:hypothetical protein